MTSPHNKKKETFTFKERYPYITQEKKPYSAKVMSGEGCHILYPMKIAIKQEEGDKFHTKKAFPIQKRKEPKLSILSNNTYNHM